MVSFTSPAHALGTHPHQLTRVIPVEPAQAVETLSPSELHLHLLKINLQPSLSSIIGMYAHMHVLSLLGPVKKVAPSV